ncbi:MAG: hypothetical protein IPK19_04095 [Chloroflexi bacterium]|nr:hypothetical protein [Chloroflexota bacterium]
MQSGRATRRRFLMHSSLAPAYCKMPGCWKSALHWIDPEVRFRKPHQLLKPGGHFAIIDTVHVSDEVGDRFFFASQPIYKRHTPAHEFQEDFRPSRLGEVQASQVDEILFKPIFFKAFSLVIRYSTEQYAQLLNTYSPTLAMNPADRVKFLREMRQLIDDQYGGSILKHFAMALTIAKKSE